MASYGQFSEDLFIISYFSENRKHYAIEVGAADGIHGSPTKLLEENGWDVLCLEPNPLSFKLCQKNRKYSMNYAIGKECLDNVDFTVFNLIKPNNKQEAISSLIPDDRLIQQHKQMGLLLNNYFEKVNLRTLDFCLELWIKELNLENPIEIDFINIDTEGTELDVLTGFNIDKWKPKLVALENNFEEASYRNKMAEYNYTLINRIGVNDFYAKS